MKLATEHSIPFKSHLFPKYKILGTPWYSEWVTKESENLSSNLFWISFWGIIIHVMHFFFVDMPAGKIPVDLWIKYRFGIAGFCLISAIYYHKVKSTNLTTYRFLAFSVLTACCYFQGQTILWWPGTPFFFSFILAFLGVIALRLSLPVAVLFNVFWAGIQIPPMVATNVPNHLIVSYLMVGIFVSILSRLTYAREIKYFIREKEYTDMQRKNIELTLEFSNQIQAFLPKEIVKRINRQMTEKKMSVVQSIDEILRPRTIPIACLYSDIRNYTSKSKDLNFIRESAIAEIKQLNNPIEEMGGIPRKIGDLLFAYFDSKSKELNVVRSLIAAMEVLEINQNLNQLKSETSKIIRKVIITSGDAVCGNLGSHDSGVEITALGSPVNLAARIDELTKNPFFKEILGAQNVILSSETWHAIQPMLANVTMKIIRLSDYNVIIRDFESEKEIVLIEASVAMQKTILIAFQKRFQKNNEIEVAA